MFEPDLEVLKYIKIHSLQVGHIAYELGIKRGDLVAILQHKLHPDIKKSIIDACEYVYNKTKSTMKQNVRFNSGSKTEKYYNNKKIDLVSYIDKKEREKKHDMKVENIDVINYFKNKKGDIQ